MTMIYSGLPISSTALTSHSFTHSHL